MNAHTQRVLEFEKVIAIAAGHAMSAPGRAALAGLLPSADASTVETRLMETGEFIGIIRSGERPPLDSIKDVRSALQGLRAAGGMLSPAELFDMATTLSAARQAKAFFRKFEGQGGESAPWAPLLCGMASKIRPLKEIEAAIFSAVDEKAEVKDSASPELRKIRKHISRTRDEILSRLSKVLQDGESRRVVQEPVVTIRDDRYVLPLKPNFRPVLKGVVHGQSSSRATLFVEPLDVLDQNNRLAELRIDEREEIERILRSLTSLLSQELDAAEEDFDILVELDVVYGRARFGLEFGGSVPQISERGRIRFVKARHPLLVWKSRGAGGSAPSTVVPNDVELGGENRVVIISGPNAGGKTVILKTVGLFCLMAQSGLPVTAAEGSEFPVFGSVFADIGDEQSLEQDLSTFSSHVSRLSEILREAQGNSLVLLDELGAGTDPAEGAALGAAALEELLGRGCMTVTTTHHGTLKLFGSQTGGVMNAAVEFDPETLKPTYRLIPGRPGRSYGLSMAARLGVPAEVIEKARARLSPGDARMQELLEGLEYETRVIKSRNEALERELEAARKERAEAETALRAARDEARSITVKARGEAREVLASLRQKLRELSRTQNMERDEAKKASSEVEALGRRLTPAKQETDEVPAGAGLNTAPGDRVRIPRLNKTGTVLVSHKGMLELEVDGIKLKLSAGEVLPAGEQTSRKSGAAVSRGWGTMLEEDQELPLRLNLLGLHVPEAIAEVDRHIDRASLSGRSFVTIIHGMGTGALKTAVTDFLKNHPLVARIRSGEPAEGGAGVTVAELKK